MSTQKINQSENFFTRLLMLQGGMTSSEFCRFVGVSTPLYQKWKNGSVPGYDKLKLIAMKFGKSPDWLLGISTAPPEPEAKTLHCAAGPCPECARLQAENARLNKIIDKLVSK